MNSKLTHIDKSGSARMVDISGKEETQRIAIAKGAVIMLPETLELDPGWIFEEGRCPGNSAGGWCDGCQAHC